MKNKNFLVALFCIILLFLGLLISRDFSNSNLNANVRNLMLDSTDEIELDDSCTSLCEKAYCLSVDSKYTCEANYNLCVSQCHKTQIRLTE